DVPRVPAGAAAPVDRLLIAVHRLVLLVGRGAAAHEERESGHHPEKHPSLALGLGRDGHGAPLSTARAARGAAIFRGNARGERPVERGRCGAAAAPVERPPRQASVRSNTYRNVETPSTKGAGASIIRAGASPASPPRRPPRPGRSP